jgi:hypothetical protein
LSIVPSTDKKAAIFEWGLVVNGKQRIKNNLFTRRISMAASEKNDSTLVVPARTEYLPLVQAAVEKIAPVVGLSNMKTLKTILAVEEIFCYLCTEASRNERITLSIGSRSYFMHATFRFSIDEDNFHNLNLLCKGRRATPKAPIKLNLLGLTSTEPDIEEEMSDLDDIGLIFASRSVDRFYLEKITEDQFEISLIQEKEYPEVKPEDIPSRIYESPFHATLEPAASDLREAAALVQDRYHQAMYPGSFKQPGKLAEAVISGQYGACIVLDHNNYPAGLLCWHHYNKQSAAFYGPYVFDKDNSEEIAHLLAEHFLEFLGPMEDVLCVFSLRTTSELPPDLFIRLGGLHIAGPNQGIVMRPAYFSFLPKEKPVEIWAHPELEPYLRNEYKRLGLVRNIRLGSIAGEDVPVHSVISADIDRVQGEVVLRPLWGGGDISQNIIDHVEAIRQDTIPNVFFQMDLAQPWQTTFAPALLDNGFSPKLVLPYAGDMDILVFQHEFSV